MFKNWPKAVQIPDGRTRLWPQSHMRIRNDVYPISHDTLPQHIITTIVPIKMQRLEVLLSGGKKSVLNACSDQRSHCFSLWSEFESSKIAGASEQLHSEEIPLARPRRQRLTALTKMTFSISLGAHQWNIPVESYFFTLESMLSIWSFPGINKGSCLGRKGRKT